MLLERIKKQIILVGCRDGGNKIKKIKLTKTKGLRKKKPR